MGKVRVACFAVSVDGYGAGPRQSLENPLGEGGAGLFKWFHGTDTFQKVVVGSGGSGTTGIDDAFARRSFDNVGAWILGRNMFGPVRGPWPDHEWKGWWGPSPPYHVPVFVLTHHARPTLTMDGGTVFHFVTGGIHEAFTAARKAANGRDVRIGGGVATIRQFLQEGLIDEMHLAQTPALLGTGERLFEGVDASNFECVERVAGEGATHLVLRKTKGAKR